MDDELAWIERRGELLQGEFLAGAFDAFEQDDRAAAVGDLGQLQLGDMLAQRCERGRQPCATRAACNTDFPVEHRTRN
jgi:hypothetical protein